MSLLIELLYDITRSKLTSELIGKQPHRISIDLLPLGFQLLSEIAAHRKICIAAMLNKIVYDRPFSSGLRSRDTNNFHCRKKKNKKAEALLLVLKCNRFQFRLKTFGRQKNYFFLDRPRIEGLLLFDALTGKTQTKGPQLSQTH